MLLLKEYRAEARYDWFELHSPTEGAVQLIPLYSLTHPDPTLDADSLVKEPCSLHDTPVCLRNSNL